MNMKTCCYFLIALVGCIIRGEEVEVQFAHEQPYLEKFGIERGRVKALPSSVIYGLSDDGRHQITISGLYPFKEGENPEEVVDIWGVTYFPEATAAECSVEGATLRIMSKLPVSYDWLAWVTQRLGFGTGVVPTWSELKARDLAKSGFYDDSFFLLEEFKGEFPVGLAWYCVEDSEIKFPFNTDLAPYVGGLILSPTRGLAPAPAKFSIRILDEKGGVVWQRDEVVQGKLRVAIGSRQKSGAHEFYIKASDYTGRQIDRYVLRIR